MWVNVSIRTRAKNADALSDALMARGALSVSVEDADAGTENETPQFGEPGSPATPLWANSKVVALFTPANNLLGTVTAAAQELGLDNPADIEFQEVAEQDWVQLTQSQFEPIKIHEKLWIVPSWHMEKFFAQCVGRSEQTPSPQGRGSGVGPVDAKRSICLQIDPGMAFGTGSHPTTRLCLEWLIDAVRDGDSLLDYGCGSGILAIAAAKLGAQQVVGVEIDEQAIKAARRNADQNHAAIDVRHSSQRLAEKFTLVIANILTNPLCVLAPLLASRLAPGAKLALSGILESQAQMVIEAYAPHMQMRVGAVREGWCRLEGINAQC